ncbi:hypothetical protein UA45_13075 [Morganella morganii]|uniref:Uncharacterized protein n=1 Tax=Morganella morganii TaxID=582 RepID=A0A0D8L8C2_MORMO|nr:hypothetical protein UA45_13075 [Morganella morganii]
MSVNLGTAPKFTPVFLSIMDRVAERKAAAQEAGDIETAERLAAMYDGTKPEDYLVEPIREINGKKIVAYINRARNVFESDFELGDKVYDRHTIIDLMGFRIKRLRMKKHGKRISIMTSTRLRGNPVSICILIMVWKFTH